MNQENEETKLLLGKGVEFKVKTKSFISKLLKKEERTFIINPLFNGTLLELSYEFSKMEFSQEKLQENGLTEVKRLMKHSKVLSNIIAISVLNNRLKIRLFKGILSRYFLWRLTPSETESITTTIHYMMDLEGFTNSIRLNAIHKAMSPSPIETDN